MSFENFGLVFDAAVAVLLIVFIGYAFVLNRKLTQLRDGKEEMARLARELGESLDKAQRNLDTLKEAAAEKAGSLQEQLDRADSLADDLAFLVRKSDIAAQKLDLAGARNRNPLAQDPSSMARPPAARAKRARSDAAASPPAGSAQADASAQSGARPLAEKLEEARLRAGAAAEENRSASASEQASQSQGAAAARPGPRSDEENRLLKVLQDMR